MDAVPTTSVDAIPASSADDVPAVDAVPASADDVPAADAVPTHDLDLMDIHLQGSSRTTGGILRGHAAASHYSPADEENKIFSAIAAPEKLIAKIYTSNLDPLSLNRNNMAPSSKVTIKMNPNLGPILDNISQCYPAIKGLCYFIFIIVF